jgi:hypothetical protein
MRPKKEALSIWVVSPDPTEQLLLRYDAPFPPAPKTLDSLLALVKNSGHLVPRDERMSGVGAR